LKVENPGGHEAIHKALVERITGQLRPVRPLWPIRVRLAIWLLVDALVLACLWSWRMRPDLASHLRSPQFLLELGLFIAGGQILAFLALSAAVPGREASRFQVGIGGAVIAAGILLLAREPSATYGSGGEFVSAGIRCMCASLLFATLPWLTLFWAVRRGAVFARLKAGALVAGAALLFTFAIQRGGCPLDDRLHLLVWHLVVPGAILIAISSIVAARWVRPQVPQI
jgi:hypothetical protein